MFRRSTFLAVYLALFAFFAVSQGSAEEYLSDFLKLPPVMSRQIGNPVIIVKTGARGFYQKKSSSNSSCIIRLPEESPSKEAIRNALAEGVLKKFYQMNFGRAALSGNEKRLNVSEIIPMNQKIFVSLGMNRLRGKREPSRVKDTWWNVRMGLSMHRNHTHQLLITNLHWENPPGKKKTLGHFCFALRKKGGDPNNDVMFDFRAPWPYKRRPRFTEAVNIHNRLKLEGRTVNLYDWFCTQTEHRNCYANMWVVPLYEEQLLLLRDFSNRKNWIQAGNFRVGKKNCASLGAHFLDRILPIGEEIQDRGKLFDYPTEMAESVVKRFSDKNVFLKLENLTQKLGREPNAKSELRAASPSRAASRPFRFLLKDPRIN